MKKSLFYLFMLICSVSLFTACSDDDDEGNGSGNQLTSQVIGGYKGTLNIYLAAGNEEMHIGVDIPKNITIAEASKTSVNMELKDFSFMNMDLGTISLQNCELTKDGDNYKFAGKQKLTVQKYSLVADIDAEGIISGNVVTVNLDIAAKLSDLTQNVRVVYSGTKLTGSESSEAKITNFIFDSDVVTEQPVIDEEKGIITFTVRGNATVDQLKLIPEITVSNKAMVTPASGVEQNFGQEVKYTVMAENGNTRVYKVIVKHIINKFDFESWEEQKGEGDVSLGFYSPVGGYWDTSNTGVYLIKAMLGETYPELADTPFAVEKVTDAHLGTGAAKVSTIDSKGAYGMIPKITAGTLFLGYFNTEYAMTSALMCTRFGLVWNEKPLKVTGFYKYLPGDVYYRCDDPEGAKDIVVEDKSMKDACMISAVLYEISDESEGQYLDGTNIYTSSDRVVALAQFSTDEKVDDYAPFTLTLDYVKEYNSAKKYRFAVIASSSANGDKFSGAPGSTLYLDDIEIINE